MNEMNQQVNIPTCAYYEVARMTSVLINTSIPCVLCDVDARYTR